MRAAKAMGSNTSRTACAMKYLILSIVVICSAANADECSSAKTQADLNACASRQFQQLDEQLNKVYAAYRARLNQSQKQQLKEVQLAWVKFRDLGCTFESSGVAGGSAHPMVFHQCLSSKTQVRLGELKALAACEEGDMSCPVWK